MNLSSWMIAVATCAAAFAQSDALMKSDVNQNGIQFTAETRLEPPTPPFAGGFVGGVVTDSGIHRYMAYRSLRTFFGYDLQVLPVAPAGSYSVTLKPLSIGPARIELDNPETWNVVPMPAYPAPQIVHGGDTIAIDLFVNPSSGQKIVDYLHFPKPGANFKIVQQVANYYISGEIRKAGSYPLLASKTVLDAINDAGGPGDFAKVRKIYILRGQQKIPFNYADVSKGRNLEQNVVLQNGDVIVVP